jgi:hypothetical protein
MPCGYAECHIFNVMLSVIMPSVIMLIVAAPIFLPFVATKAALLVKKGTKYQL